MSGLPSKKAQKELETLLARKFPLAKVSWGGVDGGKHGRVVVEYGGKEVSFPISTSASDRRAWLNVVSTIRNVFLRQE
jgi:hypothetical protein